MRELRRRNLRQLLATGASVGALVSFVGVGGVASAATSAHHGAFSGMTLTALDGAPTGADVKQTEEYYNYVAKVFKQQTGATLKWQYYSSPSQEVTDIETATVSGSGPDVISYGTSFVGTLWATGDFTPLSNADWNELGGKSSFMQSTFYDAGVGPTGLDITNVKAANKYIGVINEVNPFVLAYNTKDFKEAGIANPPKTWNQLVSDAQAIQSKVKGVYGVAIDPQDPYDPWKNDFFYDAQLGGGKPWEWVSPNGKAVNFNTPQMKKAVQFYFSLEDQFHVSPPQSLGWNGSEAAAAFEKGQVAMFILGSYGWEAAVKGTPVQNDLGFALLPTVPYGDSTMPMNGIPVETETTGNYFAIPKYVTGKLKDLAIQFDKVTVSPAVQLYQFKLNGDIPVNNAGIKAVEAYAPQSKVFVEAEEAAIPTSAAPVWSYVEPGVLTAMHNIGSYLATHGSKWDQSYADQQLAQANAAAQAHT
jgi:multiple sugar transport system substrate-binding protein